MTWVRSAAVAACLSLAVVACRCGPAATRYLVEVPAPDAAAVPPELVLERLPDLVIDLEGELLDFEPLAGGGGIVAVGRGDVSRVVHVDDDGRVVRELLEFEADSTRLDLAIAGDSVWVGIAFGYDTGGTRFDWIRYRGRERRAVGSRPGAANGDLLVLRIRIADAALEVERQLGDHAAVRDVHLVARPDGVDIAVDYGALKDPAGTTWGQPASAIRPGGMFVARLDERAEVAWFAALPGDVIPSIASDETSLVAVAETRESFVIQGRPFDVHDRRDEAGYVVVFDGDGRIQTLENVPWPRPYDPGPLLVRGGAIYYAEVGSPGALWVRSAAGARFVRSELGCELLNCVASEVSLIEVGALVAHRSFDADLDPKLEVALVSLDSGERVATAITDGVSFPGWWVASLVRANEVVYFALDASTASKPVLRRVLVVTR